MSCVVGNGIAGIGDGDVEKMWVGMRGEEESGLELLTLLVRVKLMSAWKGKGKENRRGKCENVVSYIICSIT